LTERILDFETKREDPVLFLRRSSSFKPEQVEKGNGQHLEV